MFCCKKIDAMSASQLFVFGARLTFGPWLLFVGLMKWINGYSGFVGYLSNEFSTGAAWLPAPIVLLTTWIILFAEPLIGLWIITGISQRCAWLAATMLMFMLTLGQTMLTQYATVANNWQYLVLTLVCAGLSSNNSCCGEKKTCCNTENSCAS